jgi:SAM-dependent methyltransferase
VNTGSKNVPNGASGTCPGRLRRCSVAFVAVNSEQAEDWNGPSGRHFIEQRERWERMRGGLTVRLLAGAQIQDGDNVLDIGCGCGDTTILSARATGSGHSLGADLSQIQVAEARRLAAAAGVTNARFEVADAQVHPFQAGIFDVVLSAFGVMFFDDPAAAFGNLRKALRRGGRLAFLCWRTRDENPFFTFGFAQAAAVLCLREMPGPDAAFSLADTGEVSALLSAKEVLTGLSPAQADELTRQVRDRLVAYASPGGVTMPTAAWLVTAHAV